MKDYYKILGLDKSATADQIKRAYRSLALKYHPDRGAEASEEKFKEINEAYQVLGDETKKRQYDQFGTTGNMGGGGGGFNTGGFQNAQGFDFHFEGMDDISQIFESFFGGGANFRAQAARRARNIQLMMTISFEEMLKGASKEITYQRVTDASGKRGNESLTLEVPVGVEDGTQLKLVGKGHLGSSGEEPGDLYVQIRVKPSQTYQREGLDLLRNLDISYPLAVLGGTKEVETPHGKVKLKVPSGSEDGKILRIKGEGIKTKSRQGDLYIKLKILVPKKVSLKERKLLEELGKDLD